MEQEEFTLGGKFRLTAVILLLLVSILILVPAPTYMLWELEIATTEWSTYLAIFALVLLVPGWKYGRYSLMSSLLALMVFCISALPLIRALEVGETLQADLESAFGPAAPRQIEGAPALIKPITLRLLLSDPAAPYVEVQTVNYAPRVSGFLQMDLYKSTVLPAPRPVVIVVHGGSWQGGDRTDLPDLNYYLAARGYYVAAIDYRLAPQFKNPAQTEDLNDAIDYLKRNASPLGVDPKRIALLGRSAGGHLVLLSAYTKRDPNVKGVVALYPPTDQIYGYQNPSRIIPARQILRDYIGGTPQSHPREYMANSPVGFVDANSPPTLLIHGTKDELVSVRQSAMLAERLAAKDRPHLMIELPWATHGCDYVFNGPCGQLSTYAIERFLAAVLR